MGVTTALLAALGALSGLQHGGDAQCDYTQYVAQGAVYDIKSPNYPYNYNGGASCRWRANADAGNVLVLSCGYFNIPQSQNCQTDRVSISLSGDDSLNDAHVYCGRGTFTLTSDANKLTMVLKSVASSSGGAFLCNITAVAGSPQCLCGIKKQSRIVGGEETGINEYPMMAGLVDAGQRELYCGATVASAHYAITAAHCLVKREIASIGLLVGEHDTSTGSETSATKLYPLSRFIIHDKYDATSQDYDIALVRVSGVIAMSREVMPACLPIRYAQYDFANQKVEVLGWGTTEYGGASSTKLLKALLYVQSPAQCSAVYGDEVSTRQMCTYNSGKDACQSDSGGPVLWQDPYTGRVHLVAVISHGIACATTSPGVNTRITAFLDWITQRIGAEDQYCIV